MTDTCGASTGVTDNQLPEYTGEMACCFACDSADASTEYLPPFVGGARQMLDRRDPTGNPWPSQAFLKRVCLRCGYEWAEALVSREAAVCGPQAGLTGYCTSRFRGMKCIREVGHEGMHHNEIETPGGSWIWNTADQD